MELLDNMHRNNGPTIEEITKSIVCEMPTTVLKQKIDEAIVLIDRYNKAPKLTTEEKLHLAFLKAEAAIVAKIVLRREKGDLALVHA